MTEQNQLNWQRTNLDNIEQAWDGDLWDRKRLGIQLTNYVNRLNFGAVLALDARWGEGKTWFVRHWKKHLEEENHNVIYLDAFANDYLEDPFLVISSEITSCLSKDDDVDQSHINIFKEKASAAYQALLPSLPKVLLTLGLNLISGGLLGTLAQQVNESGKEVIESATGELGDKIKESIESKIENHEADKNTLQAFKQELARLADELDKPIVFLIDELDRCRPDFAIRLIERIKHFFDIPKIVFVLVMDKAQFSKVVSHNYGYDVDLGEEYLDKFIDLNVRLPRIKLYEKNLLDDFISDHACKLGLRGEEHNGALSLAALLSLHRNLTKRTLKKIISEYSLYSFDNADLNEFLMYLLFNKKMITEYNGDVKNFFVKAHRDLIEICELYLTEYKHNAYSEIELLENRTMNEKELNEWCYSQVDSNFLKQIHIILNDEQKGMFDILEFRLYKYHLQGGNSEVGMLESWEIYLYL